MALNGARLATAIYDALVTAGLAIEDSDARDVWEVIADEIVSEITTNGDLTGVTSGGDTVPGGIS